MVHFFIFFSNVLKTTITLSTVISIFQYSVHNVTKRSYRMGHKDLLLFEEM